MYNPNDNLDERRLHDPEYVYGWTRNDADDDAVDMLAEVQETLFKMVRSGELEVVPDTNPPRYRRVDNPPVD
jgi:hypothetical protein